MRHRFTSLVVVLVGLAVIAMPVMAQSGKRNRKNNESKEREYAKNSGQGTIPVIGLKTKKQIAAVIEKLAADCKKLGEFTLDKKKKAINFKLKAGNNLELAAVQKLLTSCDKKLKTGDPQLLGICKVTLDFGEMKPDWRKFRSLRTQLRGIKNVITTRPKGRGGFEIVCKAPGTKLSTVRNTIVKVLSLKVPKGKDVIATCTWIGPPKKEGEGEHESGDGDGESNSMKGNGKKGSKKKDHD